MREPDGLPDDQGASLLLTRDHGGKLWQEFADKLALVAMID